MNLPKLRTFLIIVCIFCIGILSLKIRKISCFTNLGNCPDKYDTFFQKYLQKPLYSKVDLPPNENFIIKDIQISKNIMGELKIYLIYRQPLISVSPNLAIDNEGLIMGVSNNHDLPILISNSPKILGNFISPLEKDAAILLTRISKLFSKNLKGTYNEKILEFNIESTKIQVDIENIPLNIEYTLQKLLSGSKIKSNIPKIIDLRFSQPVLTY